MLVLFSGENIAFSEEDLLDRVISYPHDKPTVMDISDNKYILPTSCSFLMSDASNLKPLISYGMYDYLSLSRNELSALWLLLVLSLPVF